MFKKILSKSLKNIDTWARKNLAGIFLFNLALIVLTLFRLGGYFKPYFSININFIYLASIILSISLLKAKSRAMFILGLLFWIFAGFLKVLRVDVWAERTVEYVFQAMFAGILLLFYERLAKYNS
jgi:hypothetical protein